MPRRGPKGRSLSIYLLKQEFSTPERALLSAALLLQSRVIVGGRDLGHLYVKPTSDRVPSWLSLFSDALAPPPHDLHNASAAAVFLLGAGGRSFALSFGYGRSLLRPGAWEEDFGLKVTLNVVDPRRIRSVDRVKFDAISQHSQIQANRDANIIEFGLDVEQDILRAVTGKPRDPALATQLTGKDALKANVRVMLADLPGLLVKFLEASRQTAYREHFSWVDQVNELRDPVQIEQLDSALLERIRARDFDRLWLAIPDRVEWEGMAGFKYRDAQRADLYADIHFNTFLQDAGEHFVPTLDTLRNRRRVYLVSYASESAVATWSVYQCIYCEIERGGETFLLNNAKWYRVSSEFLASVNTSFQAVADDTVGLPDYFHDDEAAYNRSVADGAPDLYCLMDQKLIRYPTGRDEIEFCDLYACSKRIVHVKRYRGSATLSHLFSQGLISGELFCALPEFREGVNNFLPEAFRIMDTSRRPAVDEFEVVFAIVSKSRQPLNLPFFSRVNLRNASQRLRAFGYKVAITKIQAVDNPANARADE